MNVRIFQIKSGREKNPTIAGLDGSIIILFYLEQQHSSLQQAQSQSQLQGLPSSHPLQEHVPLQHLHS